MFVHRRRLPRTNLKARVKHRSGKFVPSLKKMLRSEIKSLISSLPNFARACGRVSVGRYPDKRPDSRQGMKNRGSLKLEWPASLSRDAVEGLCILCNRDWQPEANRRTPLSTGDAT